MQKKKKKSEEMRFLGVSIKDNSNAALDRLTENSNRSKSAVVRMMIEYCIRDNKFLASL